MRRLYPFVKNVTNILLLIAVTLSFLSFPVLALICAHSVCKSVLQLSLYSSQLVGTWAFIVVGFYSFIGLVYMYIRYFKKGDKKTSA